MNTCWRFDNEERIDPSYYEIGNHSGARKTIKTIHDDLARGEAYLVLQDLIDIDSRLIVFPDPTPETRLRIHYEETMKQRQSVAERLEKILTQHTGLDKWKVSPGSPYKVERTTFRDEYDLILNITTPSKTGKPRKVASVRGTYELGTYRVILTKGKETVEYADRPDTYDGCETRLMELAQEVISGLSKTK